MESARHEGDPVGSPLVGRRRGQEARGRRPADPGRRVLADGKRLLSGAEDGEAILWDVASGSAIRRFRTAAPRIASVAILPDGRRALVAGGQRMTYDFAGYLALIDLETGEVLRCFEGL